MSPVICQNQAQRKYWSVCSRDVSDSTPLVLLGIETRQGYLILAGARISIADTLASLIDAALHLAPFVLNAGTCSSSLRATVKSCHECFADNREWEIYEPMSLIPRNTDIRHSVNLLSRHAGRGAENWGGRDGNGREDSWAL